MSARSLLARVAETRRVRDYILWLRFADGLEGEVDLGDGIWGEVLEPLRDRDEFARAAVQYGTVVWPSGADWSPEDLYDRLLASPGFTRRPYDDARESAVTNASAMPEISRFYGIVIQMMANDHEPPNFHAVYGEFGVTLTIQDGVVTGRFPRRALRLVLEWSDLHSAQLVENWERLRAGQLPMPIEPLT